MNQTLSVFSSVLTVLLAAMVAAFFCLLPEWTRRGMLFAVNVPANFRKTSEGRRILRDYRLQACAHAVMSFALIYVGAFTSHLTLLLLGIFWLPAGYFLIFQWARDRVEPHAVFRSAALAAPAETQNSEVPAGWLLHLGPFAILGATALFLHSRFQRIPLRFPIRGGFPGRPRGFAFPTREGIYGPLILAGVICAVLWLLSYGVQRRGERARRVQSSGRRGAMEIESLNRTLSVMLGSEYLLAVICSAASGLLPFMGFWVMLPLGALAMVAVAALFLLAAESPEEAME
jgi:uncharacterized membrane protein